MRARVCGLDWMDDERTKQLCVYLTLKTGNEEEARERVSSLRRAMRTMSERR